MSDPGTSAEAVEQAVAVIGVGADGWAGLADPARDALSGAQVVIGSDRQLALLPTGLSAERVAWPMPLLASLASTLNAHAGRRRAVLASGDPTFYGIASTIARLLPDVPLRVIPHPSSLSLACARLGWAQQDVDVVSLVGRPVAALVAKAFAGRRLLVLAEGVHSPGQVSALLCGRGLNKSRVIVLSNLGAGDEQRVEVRADAWPVSGWPASSVPESLSVIAVECVAEPETAWIRLPLTPGLPDEAYEHDGQLTKRHVRAVTLAALAPEPGELLWDVGGGAGSIGIEWMRAHPSCRAICVERDSTRAKRIEHNATTLGVPGLRVVLGTAPGALGPLGAPDAIFIGGGVTADGLIEACWSALGRGGRLVANVTTLESEQVVLGARSEYGGELTRIEIVRAAPVGRFTGWRPSMPVTQWSVTRR